MHVVLALIMEFCGCKVLPHVFWCCYVDTRWQKEVAKRYQGVAFLGHASLPQPLKRCVNDA